mgnify:CR=1 FL=1
MLEYVNALPAQLLELLCADAVVREETAFVAAYGEMVYQHGAGDRGVCGRVEIAFKGRKKGIDVAVEFADLVGDSAYKVGLVGWEVGEGLSAFGVLDLQL